MRLLESETRRGRLSRNALSCLAIALMQFGVDSRRIPDNTQAMRDCLRVTKVGVVDMLTYDDEVDCRYPYEPRGNTFRTSDTEHSRILRHIDVPSSYRDNFAKHGFMMSEQEGGTCFLTCIAAAISDLNLNANKEAIDPFVLSDMLEAVQAVPDDPQTADGLNVSYMYLDSPEEQEVLHTLPRPIETNNYILKEPENAHIVENEESFLAFIRKHITDADTHVILSMQVNSQKRHAVVVVGLGADPQPFLIVSEPNGAHYIHSDTFELVRDNWEHIGDKGKFSVRINIDGLMLCHMTGITLVRAVE